MAKTEKNKSPEASVEELKAKLAQLHKENDELKGKVEEVELPSFKVKGGGEFQFVYPSITVEGAKVDVRDLMRRSESDKEEVHQPARAILAELVQIQSGAIKKKG